MANHPVYINTLVQVQAVPTLKANFVPGELVKRSFVIAMSHKLDVIIRDSDPERQRNGQNKQKSPISLPETNVLEQSIERVTLRYNYQKPHYAIKIPVQAVKVAKKTAKPYTRSTPEKRHKAFSRVHFCSDERFRARMANQVEDMRFIIRVRIRKIS